MAKLSAGVLLYRRRGHGIEVLLVHPGGPFWVNKDRRAWSIPKGEPNPGEALPAAARREFREETGLDIALEEESSLALAPLRQSGGKTVHAWAVEGDCDPVEIVSNRFTMEWPPLSGRIASYPEVDRAAWFGLDEAREKVHRGQAPLLEELERKLKAP